MSNNPQSEDVRIAFKVSPETKQRLTAHLEWGQLKLVYTAITEDLINLYEAHDPSLVTAAIVSKKVTLKSLINSDKLKELRNATDRSQEDLG